MTSTPQNTNPDARLDVDNGPRRVRVTEVTQAYWRITLDNPPLNLFDPEMYAELRELMDRIEADDLLRVIVLDSAIEDYFVGHIDLVRWPETAAGPHGAPYTQWPALVTRFVESPVVSIASIRGRARGHGNELTLACDMRFASAEKAIFGQLEVALTALPGGGGVEWLSALCGRSRALEVVLGSDDFDAKTAAAYGWINRALPDGELDDFVDRLARRIASFDPDALSSAKAAVNARGGAPSEASRQASNDEFHRLAALAEQKAKPGVMKAFSRGLQQPGDFETNLGQRLGELDPTVA